MELFVVFLYNIFACEIKNINVVMGYLRIAAVCAAFLLCSATASAQRFLWNVDFDFKFDNKEYADVEHDASVTNFTARLTPQIGLGWGRGTPSWWVWIS